MTRRWRTWLAVAGIIAAGLSLQMATPAAAATVQYTFLQFNMAGHMNHVGRTDYIVPAVTESITSSWPTAVSLNEVCENQFAQILWNANVAGGGYNAKFHTQIPAGNGVCNGHAYGLALLLRGVNPESFSVHPLSPQGGAQVMICGYTGASAQQRLGVCSSHLQPHDGGPGTPIKYKQMDEIAQRALIPLAEAGLPTAFLGDTYLNEAEMRYITRGLFSHAAIGNTKTNPNCVATTWAKALAKDPDSAHAGWVKDCEDGRLAHQFDYVMVSNNRLANISGEVTRTRWSDHLPVRGTAVFR